MLPLFARRTPTKNQTVTEFRSLFSRANAIWIADAHRDNGKRFAVRADEKLTAFLELESVIRAASGRTQLVAKQALATQFAPQGSQAE